MDCFNLAPFCLINISYSSFVIALILAIAVASFSVYTLLRGVFLWSPYVIGQTIIFLPCDFYLSSSFFFSSPNLSGRRLDVCHTFTHDVALVQI